MSRALFSSLKGQAQSALNASPLAGRLPSSITGHAPGQATTAATQGGGGSGEGSSLAQIQHSLRSLQVQYSHQASPEIRQLQLLITGEKGVALNFDGLSRDLKSQSKEFYIWGQSEKDDVKDVSDRLAYLTFVHGSLASSVSAAIDTSRAPFKAVRDAEAGLAPRRNIRAGLQQQIVQFKTQGGRAGGVDTKIASLEDQLRKAESDDAPLEREVELLKRTALRESEAKKWAALKEYSEKLLLLTQAAEALIEVLPVEPPTSQIPYNGAQSTAATRASLQKALDNYKPGQINFQHQPSLDYRDSLSFGETHASELSSIPSPSHGPGQQPHPVTTPPGQYPPQHSGAPQPYVPPQHSGTPQSYVPPVTQYHDASVPGGAGYVAAAAATHASDAYPSTTATPPIAGTGQYHSTSAATPDPAVGSTTDQYGTPRYGGSGGYGAQPLHESAEDEKRRLAAARAAADTQAAAPGSSATSYAPTPSYPVPSGSQGGYQPPQHESAEDEKKRLQREDRERLLAAPHEPGNESAEEEKRRLEREQKDRYLTSFGDPKQDEPPSGDAPPSYQG